MPKHWSPEEVEKVVELYAEHKDHGTAAAALNATFGNSRSAKAVKTKLAYLSRAPGIDAAKLDEENARLRQEITRLVMASQRTKHNFSGDTIRFGILGDTQLGSRYENLSLLHSAYDVLERERVPKVYHTGDVLDGEKMYRGHEYELHTHGCDAQIDYCVENYPQRDGVDTEFIIGNHDGSFWKHSGVDVGFRIAERRPDMNYHGMDEADITLKCATGEVILRLYHPAKGTAYALSYHSQKYIESLTGGHKPNLIGCGHYHKMEKLFYRNIHLFQTGCMQHQTKFMRGRNIAAIQGFWIVELAINQDGIARCKSEWFPCYD